ncbi:MAG: DUF6531 domain-containing protein [Proteobacteria bacterium]|nr:DUF6531 domain-containing protein [Pseudomonadota bacterium]
MSIRKNMKKTNKNQGCKKGFRKLLFLALSIIYINQVTAVTIADFDIVGLEIGEWDYAYEACDLSQTWGHDTAGEAETAGLAVRHSNSCYGPIVTEDTGYPNEEHPNVEGIPACGGTSNVPHYQLKTAIFSRKALFFDFGSYQNSVCNISSSGHMTIAKQRAVQCPEGYSWGLVPPNNDYRACIKIFTPEGDECSAGTSIGNPINVATGNKFHRETLDLGVDSIPFSLYYSSSTASQNSGTLAKRTFGKGWNHVYSKQSFWYFQGKRY